MFYFVRIVKKSALPGMVSVVVSTGGNAHDTIYW
jgi:hypothetical protein